MLKMASFDKDLDCAWFITVNYHFTEQPKQVPPDFVLQEHRWCILGLAPPKKSVINLKKQKQARAFSPL